MHERLASERYIWLTTISKNGTPQLNPVWFLRDCDDNLNTAARLTHIKSRHRYR